MRSAGFLISTPADRRWIGHARAAPILGCLARACVGKALALRLLRSRNLRRPASLPLGGAEICGGGRPAMFPPKNGLPSTPRAKPWQIMHSGNAPAHAQFGVAPEIE